MGCQCFGHGFVMLNMLGCMYTWMHAWMHTAMHPGLYGYMHGRMHGCMRASVHAPIHPYKHGPRVRWQCSRHVFILFQTRVAFVLAICWQCSGHVLTMAWPWFGNELGMFLGIAQIWRVYHMCMFRILGWHVVVYLYNRF